MNAPASQDKDDAITILCDDSRIYYPPQRRRVDNNIITTYQSLSEVTVKEGDTVAQSTVIGKAGESNLEKDLGKHVLFEISVDGNYINPDNCYGKTAEELKSN